MTGGQGLQAAPGPRAPSHGAGTTSQGSMFMPTPRGCGALRETGAEC